MTDDLERPRPCASAGSASSRACRWSSSSRRTGRVVSPVLAYLDVLDQAWPPDKEAPVTIVVLPEYVARHWWDRLLYNQTAKRLKAALVGREHTVIADVPYRREPLTSGLAAADAVAASRHARPQFGPRPVSVVS